MTISIINTKLDIVKKNTLRNIAIISSIILLLIVFKKYINIKLTIKNVLYITFIGNIVFGIIDSLMFYYVNSDLHDVLKQYIKDDTLIEFIIGGISAFVAVFMGKTVQQIIEKVIMQKLDASPIQEAIGMVIGTGLVIVAYETILHKRLVKNRF